MTETEVADIFDNKTKAPEPDKENKLIADAIDVLERGEWTRGWGGNETMCILQSVNIAKSGGHRYSTRAIPVDVIRRIHAAIYPEGRGLTKTGKPRGKDWLAADVMRWNDHTATSKRQVLGVLKKALKRERKDKGSI